MLHSLDALTRWLAYGAAAAGAGLSALVILSSTARYLVGQPFRFTEELVGLLFCAMVFLTVPYITFKNRHITVSLVMSRLPPRWQRAFSILGLLLLIAFCGAFGIVSYEFTAFSFSVGARSDMTEFQLGYWMALIPASLGLTGLIAALRLVRVALGIVDESDDVHPAVH